MDGIDGVSADSADQSLGGELGLTDAESEEIVFALAIAGAIPIAIEGMEEFED